MLRASGPTGIQRRPASIVEWSAATFGMTGLAPAGESMNGDFLPAHASLCKVLDGLTHSASSALI